MKVPQNSVQRISSRMVAKMDGMEMAHKSLLRKIDKINEDLVAQDCATQKYWIESTYVYRGQEFREYLISKLGCEFLANKSIGKKGNVFTDRYMTAFEDMKETIQTGLPSLAEFQELKNMVFELTKAVTLMLNPPTKEEPLTKDEELFLNALRRNMNRGYILPSNFCKMFNISKQASCKALEKLGIIYIDEGNKFFTEEYDDDKYGRYVQFGEKTYIELTKDCCLKAYRLMKERNSELIWKGDK